MAVRLARILMIIRPHRGWVSLLLTLSALFSVPAALISAIQGRISLHPVQALAFMRSSLYLVCLASVLLGYRLARSRLSPAVACLLSTVCGVALVAGVEGQLFPSLALFWRELIGAGRWIGSAGWTQAAPLPFATLGTDIWQRVAGWSERLWWDGYGLLHGLSFWDSHIYLLLAALAVWLMAFAGIWGVFRSKSVLSGVVPSGAILSVLVLYHPPSAVYLIAFLFCVLWLLAMSQLWKRWDSWQESGIDYPDGLGTELVLAIGPVVFALVLLAAFVPVLGSNRLSRAFWLQVENLVGPLSDPDAAAGERGSLPSTHLLSGRPDVGQELAFYVKTDEQPTWSPAPGEPAHEASPDMPRHYWRQETYDVYTGRGWRSSVWASQEQPAWQLIDGCCEQGEVLKHEFEIPAVGTESLYAVNAPSRISVPVTTWWRTSGDLVRLSAQVSQYTAISRRPRFGLDDLRAAPETVSATMAQHYLTLPESLPPRVYALSDLVIDKADTAVDKALAIEAFMRTYSYTLSLPDPPRNRDLVDYFLFDLQAGYCDYYASAMVVLARAAGLPARLASGYAGGTYDPVEGRWVVTEEDAHSWVEVFFEGIGWVEFEPTAAQPAPVRTGDVGLDGGAAVPLPRRVVPWWRRLLPGVLLGLGMAVGLLKLIPYSRRLIRGPWSQSTDWSSELFSRVQAWGCRCGLCPEPGQTPWEYAEALIAELLRLQESARCRRLGDRMPDVELVVGKIVDLYVLTHYGRWKATEESTALLRHGWKRLRRWFIWLWIDKRLRWPLHRKKLAPQ